MAVVTKGMIPAHHAIPINDCESAWDRECASCAATGKSFEGVTCVTVMQEFSAKISGWLYWDFREGNRHHFCAPCYRAIFGSE